MVLTAGHRQGRQREAEFVLLLDDGFRLAPRSVLVVRVFLHVQRPGTEKEGERLNGAVVGSEGV